MRAQLYGTLAPWFVAYAENRRFGIYSEPDHPGEYVFYTMGVDRAWDWIFDKGNNFISGIAKADSL